MHKKTYFLLAPQVGLVKIGSSEHPLARLTALRTMNAAETEPLVILHVLEHELHEKFAADRHHGEWFCITQAMIDYFDEIKEHHAACRLQIVLEEQDGK